ncbi:hypothetical protein [uncultured Friedmanniella sp.]|uniref:hypothetical protein n=1 Tax=uncultured Friedmanniella sp. TaxID=335381 RepID=UPI0035CB9329
MLAARVFVVSLVVTVIAGLIAAFQAHSDAVPGADQALLLRAQFPAMVAVGCFVLGGVAGAGLAVLWGVTQVVNQAVEIVKSP